MTGSMRKDDTSAEQTIYHFLEKNLYENLKNQYSPNFDFWQCGKYYFGKLQVQLEH